MTEPLDESSKARLREALRAEVDGVRPAGDGLERIRARTSARRFPWLDSVLGTWLRPVAALAVTALLAGSVILSMPQLRDSLLTTGDQQAAPATAPDSTEETAAGEVSAPSEPQTHATSDPEEATPSPTGLADEAEDLAEEQLLAAAEECSVEPEELLAARDGGGPAALSADEAQECLDNSEPTDSGDQDSTPTDPPTDDPSPTESPTEDDPPPEPTDEPEDD